MTVAPTTKHTPTPNGISPTSPDPECSDRPTGHDQLARPSWLPPEQWPFALRRHRHRTASDEMIDIHYTDHGNGPTLVFIHAGMWSFVWRDVIAGLSSDFRCIALDFPGTGLSGGHRPDIDIATFPAIVDAVLDRCGIDEATIVVHDLGGVVGVLTALERADHINGLVVANSFGWEADRFALRTMLRLMGSRSVTAVVGTLRLIPRMSRTKMGVGRHLDRDSRRAFFGPYGRRAMSRNFHRTMRSAMRSASTFTLAENALHGPLARLPVLTIFGEKNDPFAFGERWKQLFPDANQWVVPGGNHFPMCDDPEGFVEHLRSWHAATVGPVPTAPT